MSNIRAEVGHDCRDAVGDGHVLLGGELHAWAVGVPSMQE